MAENRSDTSRLASPRRVVVRTGSRLHFGLMNTIAPFGGVGVMLDQPAGEVDVVQSNQFACEGEDRQRIVDVVQRLADFLDQPGLPPCCVRIRRRPSAHCGLGSGTQISLAVAEAVSRFLGYAPTPEQLAVAIADRGKRSAVGVHGYFTGGMIYEASDVARSSPASVTHARLNPVQQRVELPEAWTVLLLRPAQTQQGVSGACEAREFGRLKPPSPQKVAALQALIEQQIMPAAHERNFPRFAASVHQYNRQSGRLFASVQGGDFNGPAVERLVDLLRQSGVEGVGQSSWGPGVFAWFPDPQSAAQCLKTLPRAVERIATAHPLNRPRELVLTQDG